MTTHQSGSTYLRKGSSDNAVHRLFCSECGSPIAQDSDVALDIIATKTGTLDSDIKKSLEPVSISIHCQDIKIRTVAKLPSCRENGEWRICRSSSSKHMPEQR
ncbi:hypothetical protein E4U41_002795 [Claviceps citrina]|nr:hypothetical protein E4U41_002795 [Claviceps citrina]